MISDITGKPATVTAMVDVANWGACVLAGVGAGLFRGDVLERSVSRSRQSWWLPRPEIFERYQEIYARYRSQEEKLLVNRAA